MFTNFICQLLLGVLNVVSEIPVYTVSALNFSLARQIQLEREKHEILSWVKFQLGDSGSYKHCFGYTELNFKCLW